MIRFGPLPQACSTLLDCIIVRIWAAKLQANAVDLQPKTITLHFSADLALDIAALTKFLAANSGRFIMPSKIHFTHQHQELSGVIALLKRFYKQLFTNQ